MFYLEDINQRYGCEVALVINPYSIMVQYLIICTPRVLTYWSHFWTYFSYYWRVGWHHPV